MIRTTIDSPIGPLTLTSNGHAITALDWGDHGRDPADPVIDRVAAELAEYFTGKRLAFDVPLDPGGTDFDRAVWRAMAATPPGRIRTYGEVADELGASARAVGQACPRNPIAILIPCHRIVAAGGALGGFSGAAHRVDLKRELLAHEARVTGRVLPRSDPAQPSLFDATVP